MLTAGAALTMPDFSGSAARRPQHSRLAAARLLPKTGRTMDLPTADASSKAALRREMRERLRLCPEDQLARWSGQLIAQLKAHASTWPKPGVIGLFGGLRSEPDLLGEFLPWLHRQGWQVALFAVQNQRLVAKRIESLAQCQRGSLGVWEPAPETSTLGLEDLRVLLVPALAYSSRDGRRLGRGGGFYDRLLADPRLRAQCLGIAYEIQLRDSIPCEAHDACLKWILTETRCLETHSAAQA